MKKIFAIIAALVMGAIVFSASAQLRIGAKSDGGKRLAVLQTQWCWLYELRGHYFFVSATDNQFDDWIWLDLGGSPAESVGTLDALLGVMEESKSGQTVEVESMGHKYTLTYGTSLGIPYFSIYSRERAGLGVMSKAAIRKACDHLNKLR